MLVLPMVAGAQQNVPIVTIGSRLTSITEEDDAVFTISASPAPRSNLTVNIKVTSGGPVISSNQNFPMTIIRTGKKNLLAELETTVRISAGRTSTMLRVKTADFEEDPDDDKNWGSVSVTIKEGTGYSIGEPKAGA